MRCGCLLALLAAACLSYDLEERRFVCSRAEDCGEGWACTGGYCARPADGGADAALEICGNGEDDDQDGQLDCQDDDCGAASCADTNPCSADGCAADGHCTADPVVDESPCGPGCSCVGGLPHERACGNNIDDDEDGLKDCLDPDCPACMGDTTCCASGICMVTCL